MFERQSKNSAGWCLWCLGVIGCGLVAPGVGLGAVALTPVGNPIFDIDLRNPGHVAVSPDGKNVYVTSQWRGGALTVWKRNAATGALEHLHVLKDGQGSVDGLAAPNEIVVSKDLRSVYVAGGGDNAVSVFSRNTSTGQLSFLEAQKSAGAGNGLGGCYALALPVKEQKHLYACGATDNTLAIFAIAPATGKLTYLEILRNSDAGLSNLHTPRSIAVTPDDSQVLVCAEGSNTLFFFNRNKTSGHLTLSKAWSNGTEGLSGLIAPAQIVISKNGLNAYVACSGFGLVVLGRTAASKPFAVLEEHPSRPPGFYLNGLRYLALSPDEKRLYASAEVDGTLTVFARDVGTGRLTRWAQVRQRLGGSPPFTQTHQVAVSPDGNHAYLATTREDGVHCFAIGGPGGEIIWNSVVVGGPGQFPGLGNGETFCVSPDGRNLYFPSGGTDGFITSFERSRTTGLLTHPRTIGTYEDWYLFDWLSGVRQIIASSSYNYRDVYACCAGGDALAHFHRDPVDGHLIFRGAYYNGSGITNMVQPWSMALAPPYRDYLYVVAKGSDSILTFQVLADGSLRFVNALVNGAATLRDCQEIKYITIVSGGWCSSTHRGRLRG